MASNGDTLNVQRVKLVCIESRTAAPPVTPWVIRKMVDDMELELRRIAGCYPAFVARTIIVIDPESAGQSNRIPLQAWLALISLPTGCAFQRKF